MSSSATEAGITEGRYSISYGSVSAYTAATQADSEDPTTNVEANQ
jgi:hypothetical protein